MTVAILVGRVSELDSHAMGAQPDRLVERATESSSDERHERLMWMHSVIEYIGTRGTDADVEEAIKKFSMAHWDSNPSKHDFAKMFAIASSSMRKAIEAKLVKPLEKTLDKEEEEKLRLKKEAAYVKRKTAKKRASKKV